MDMASTIRNTYGEVFGGEKNMGMVERVASTGFGLAVAAAGLRRGGGLSGALAGIAGAALVARGMSGHCPVKAMVHNRQHIADMRQRTEVAGRQEFADVAYYP